MLLPSIRRLGLADVNEDILRELVDHGESLLVERKREPPTPPRFGAGAAAFANTLGGFVLLGVEDDKTVVGWKPPQGSDLQSYLADLLRQQVDPLPPFVAEMRELGRKPVAVLRIFESADGPHIVRGTGAVYLRSSRGKDPVAVEDQRTLLELARGGREADLGARDRLRNQPVVNYVLRTPDCDELPDDLNDIRWVARAAPLTVTPALRDWPLIRRGAERCQEAADALAPTLRMP